MNVGKRLLQEKRAGARRVLSRPGTLRSDFDCKALERSISIDEAFGRQGNRRNLPGRGRGRCEVAAASKALPPASRPRIGLWLGSPAGASPLSCAIEVRFNSCVPDQGDNSGRELRRGWRAGIFLCFFFLLFFERGGEKKKWSTWRRKLYFSLSHRELSQRELFFCHQGPLAFLSPWSRFFCLLKSRVRERRDRERSKMKNRKISNI